MRCAWFEVSSVSQKGLEALVIDNGFSVLKRRSLMMIGSSDSSYTEYLLHETIIFKCLVGPAGLEPATNGL